MSGGRSERVVVLVARRFFNAEQKRAIVAEASVIGVNVSAVARSHSIKPSLLFRWKREAFEASIRAAAPTPPALLPVVMAQSCGPVPSTPLPPLADRRGAEAVMFEIVTRGRTLRVPCDADIESIRRFVVALEGAP